MRIAITGATGFIGDAVLRLLLEKGHEVCALARSDSKRAKLASYSIPIFQYHTLCEDTLVGQLQAWGPNVLVQLAWKGVSGAERNETFQFTENIPFTMASIQLAAAAGCDHWIGAGSQAEYGITYGKTNEELFCRPVTAYGKAKLATGIASLGLCESLRLKGAWGRIFSVYGPGDHSETLIPYLIKSFQHREMPALTPCEQQWDYLYITDAAAALVALVECGCTGVYNIGSGQAERLRSIVEILKDYIGFRESIRYGMKPYTSNQIMHLEADISKLTRDTHWQPKVSLEEGLRQTVQSVQKTIY